MYMYCLMKCSYATFLWNCDMQRSYENLICNVLMKFWNVTFLWNVDMQSFYEILICNVFMKCWYATLLWNIYMQCLYAMFICSVHMQCIMKYWYATFLFVFMKCSYATYFFNVDMQHLFKCWYPMFPRFLQKWNANIFSWRLCWIKNSRASFLHTVQSEDRTSERLIFCNAFSFLNNVYSWK